MLIFLIILCEILFWVFVSAGLAARYLLKRQTLGLMLLALTPIIDLVLLGATILDLRNGGATTMAHGLAAIYIGVSIAFGKKMIAWADCRFAATFSRQAGKAAKPPSPKHGRAHAAKERKDWLRHLLAFAIGSLLLLMMVFLVGEPAQTQTLFRIIKTWGIVLFIDFIISFSYTLWPRKEKEEPAYHAQNRRL